MNIRLYCTLAVGCLASVLPIQAAFVGTNVNFDADTVGASPPGWVLVTGGSGTTLVTNAQSRSAPNSMEMRRTGWFNDPSSADLQGLSSYFPPNDIGNEVGFSVRLTANASQQFRFSIRNASGSVGLMQLKFVNGQLIAQHDPAFNETTLAPFSVDTWYDVRIKTGASQYDVAVFSNAVLLGSASNLNYTANAAIGSLEFVNDGWLTVGNTAQQSVFVDNIFVAPEPSVTMLMGGGMLWLVAVRRHR